VLAKNDPVLSLPYYADIILKISVASAVIGVLLFFTVPFLKRWMGNVKLYRLYFLGIKMD